LYPLSATKIELARSASVTFYVNINSIHLRADEVICFSSLSIQAYTYQKVTLEFSGDDNFAKINLWESGVVASSNRSDHARRMTSLVEDKVKHFITDWNLDNKPAAAPWEGQGRGSKNNEPVISSGSGFGVTRTGDLVTNEHVVSGCSAVTVRQGKSEYTG